MMIGLITITRQLILLLSEIRDIGTRVVFELRIYFYAHFHLRMH